MNSDIPHFLHRYPTPSGITAFTTLRGEADETAPYSGFNITHYCGDEPEHVSACRTRLCAELGIDDGQLILPLQRHTDQILCLDQSFSALSPEERAQSLDGVDALVTDQRRLCIGVSTADCMPILVYSRDASVVAAVHAGWRGTVAHILSRTIARMEERYGVSPAELCAILGPAIGEESFEVGDEVYDAFCLAGYSMESIARRYPARDAGTGKWHISLVAANYLELETAGIDIANICATGIDTYTMPRDFFSARRLGIRSGRTFSGIMIQ